MSDLLNSASLVMIPSGYKEDTVYSVVPSDGSGDLSFTRASNGTRINSAGLVEVVAWNLILQSETFNNSYWNKVNGTITSDSIVAPNGTTTADLFTITNNSAFVEKTIAGTGTLFTFIPNTQYTFSCYFKKGSIDYNFKMLMYDGVSVTNSGTINLTTPSSSTVSYEDVGNGWYRFYHTFTSSASATTGYFYAVNYDYSTTITSGTNVYLWGAQVVQGSTAKPYFPTTDRLNVPRLTYQNGGGGCPSLLLEKQSTNVVTYSQQINSANGYNLSNVTSSEDSLTSPDGTINADKIIESTSNSTHAVTFISSLGGTVDSSPYCISVFVKAEGRSQILFYDNNQAVGGVSYFNLSTGVVTSGTGKIENYGNGWYRCTIFCLKDNSTSANIQLYLLDSAGNQTYTGNGTSGIGLWGYQCEASSYPTSYIPTTSSSATRVADACFKTGISSLIGQTEGTIFWNVSNVFQFSSDAARFFAYTNSNNFILISPYENTLRVLIVSSGTAFDNFITISGTSLKIAIAYKANDYKFYVNGVSVGTPTATSVPAMNSIGIINDSSGSAVTSQSETKQLILFKTRLTNAELAQLTA